VLLGKRMAAPDKIQETGGIMSGQEDRGGIGNLFEGKLQGEESGRTASGPTSLEKSVVWSYDRKIWEREGG